VEQYIDDPFDEIAAVGDLAGELAVPPHEVARRTFATSTGNLSGLVWASGSPAEIFLHGGGQNAHTWDAVMHLRRRNVLALDLPGHGESSWFDEPTYLPRTMAVPVAEVMRTLPQPLDLIVGMSLGGLTAIALAAAHPESIRGLAVVDASPGVQPHQAREVTDFVAQSEYPDFESLLQRTMMYRKGKSRTSLARSLRYNARPTASGTWVWRADRREGMSANRLASVFDDLPAYWEDMRRLRCPTLLVLGEMSPIVSADDVERYRREVADLRIVRIDGAGHNIQGDRPHELARAIEEFRATLLSSA
jgi:pimeloyl-ACP methyl ester carboxylesterase